MLVKIFLPSGKSATNVAFLLVHIKNFTDALRQGWVDLLQAVGAVFMYRTLTNSKFLRGLAHSGFMFDDIICNFYCPLLNVIFHKNNPCINCFLQSMQGHFDVCLHFPFVLSEFPLYKPYKPTLPRHTSNPIAPTATNTNPIPAAFFLFSITTNCLLSMEFTG